MGFEFLFLFLSQYNYIYDVGKLKEPSQCDGTFEHPQHILNLLVKKMIKILLSEKRFSCYMGVPT